MAVGSGFRLGYDAQYGGAIEFGFTGLDAMSEALSAVAAAIPGAAGEALKEVAGEIMIEAKLRTPVDTGQLQASGTVADPEQKGTETQVALEFGGPGLDYAVFVHENLEKRHPVGQAKFLESAVLEAAPTVADKVATRMVIALEGAR